MLDASWKSKSLTSLHSKGFFIPIPLICSIHFSNACEVDMYNLFNTEHQQTRFGGFYLLTLLFNTLENQQSVFLKQYSMAQTPVFLHTYSRWPLRLQLIWFTHSIDFFGLQNPEFDCSTGWKQHLPIWADTQGTDAAVVTFPFATLGRETKITWIGRKLYSEQKHSETM